MGQEDRRAVEALEKSSLQLAEVVEGLGPDQLERPSQCAGWSLGKVLSHIGSGSEIFGRFVEAALAGETLPGPDTFPAVWERWDSLGAERLSEAAVAAAAGLAARFGGLDDHELEVGLELFGMDVTVGTLAGWRLVEQSLHTWDLVAADDDSATLDADLADVVARHVAGLALRIAKPTDPPGRWVLETAGIRARRFELVSTDPVQFSELTGTDAAPGEGTVTVTLALESMVRLVTGRLDPSHTPTGIRAPAGELDRLRAVFPGY